MVYAAADYQGLQIIDVMPLDSSKIVGGLPSSGAIEQIWVHKNYAYVTETRFWRPSGLRILNIENPDQVYTAAQISVEPADIKFWQDYAYVLARQSVQIWDISSPSTPRTVGQLDTLASPLVIKIHDEKAYIVTLDGIYIFNLSDPIKPVKLSSIMIKGVIDIKIQNEYLLVLLWNNATLEIFDVSDPTSPGKIADLALNDVVNSFSQICVDDAFIYVISGCKLHIINMANPQQPLKMASHLIACFLRKRAVALNKRVFLTQQDGGLAVYDVSQPESLHKLGNYKFGGNFTSDLYVNDDTIYLAYTDAGLHILSYDFETMVAQSHGDEIRPYFSLLGSYPNPFNGSVRIKYQIHDAGFITLGIFDVSGREVKTLIHRMTLPGVYEVDWDGHNFNRVPVASGAYLVRMQGEGVVTTKKILLVR
jgi:hypothetical protein